MNRTHLALASLLAGLALVAGCSGPVAGIPRELATGPAASPPPAAKHVVLPPDPAQLDYDAIGAHSSLIPLGVGSDGAPEVPDVHTPGQAGWLSVYDPDPATHAPLVLIGHVDGERNGKAGQPGVFVHLKNANLGDKLKVGRKDGTTATYTVTKVRQVHKAAFPASIYAPTSDNEVRLVTCTGTFDKAKKSYEDSMIVFGTQDPPGPTS